MPCSVAGDLEAEAGGYGFDMLILYAIGIQEPNILTS
jgi:hypothetical protein